MIRRVATVLSFSTVLVLCTTTNAFSYNNGRGFYGATSDTVVTDTGFALILGFTAFVIVASLIYGYLDRRKDARKEASKARSGDPRWRGGW